MVAVRIWLYLADLTCLTLFNIPVSLLRVFLIYLFNQITPLHGIALHGLFPLLLLLIFSHKLHYHYFTHPFHSCTLIQSYRSVHVASMIIFVVVITFFRLRVTSKQSLYSTDLIRNTCLLYFILQSILHLRVCVLSSSKCPIR